MRGRLVLALAILCAVPFLNLGRRVLWPPDEGRYAVIVREMVVSDDFVVPTWAGKPNIDKPPLFMWGGAVASGLMGGVSEASVRLPSALAASLMVLATCYLGARLFDPMTGVLAALVLGTCGRYLLYSQWCATDMLLASLVTLSLAAAVGGRGAPGSGVERWNSPGSGDREGPTTSGLRPSTATAGLLFMAIAALATLTKGPVGVVLPVGIVLLDRVAAAWRRPGAALRGILSLAGPWAAGSLVFLAIATPWFLLLEARLGASGLREILFHQNVSRFLDAWNAKQPWYFYLEALPLDFLPWSFFLPLAFLPVAAGDPGRRDAWRFLRVWFVMIFAFFSAASGKSPEYLMPLLPAAALMVARLFVMADRLPSGRPGVLATRLLTPAAAVLAAGGLAGAVIAALRGDRIFPEAPVALLLSALLLLGGAVAAFVLLKSGRPAVAATALAVAILCLRSATAPFLMDAGNHYNVAPETGRSLSRVLPPGSRVGVGRKGADFILYYADVPVTPIPRPGRLAAFLREGPPNAVVLKGKDFLEMKDRLSGTYELAARFGDDRRGFVVLKALPR